MNDEKITAILENKNKVDGWNFKSCPFCNSRDIGIKEETTDHDIGYDSPSSKNMKIWAYCRNCLSQGPKTTQNIVYDDEIVAAAITSWNKRACDKTGLVHAKWLHKNDDYNDWYECSNCEYGSEGEVPYDSETLDYCPKCGAIMDIKE